MALLGLGSLWLATTLLTACAAPDIDTVKIAVAEPSILPSSQRRIEAVRMALDEVGYRAGKVRVELKLLDTSGPASQPLSPEVEAQRVREAIDDPAVVAYLGSSYTSLARAAMPLLNRAGLAQLSPTASWPGLTKAGFVPGEPGIYYPSGKRHFFRLVPSDDVAGVAAARWAHDLGFRTIYVVDNGLAYGRGLAGIFELTARDLGLTVLARESLRPGPELDVEAVVRHALATHPDLLYFGGTAPEGGNQLIPTLRQRVPGLQIMGPQELVDIPIDPANSNRLLDGILATAPSTFTYPEAPAKAREFFDRFQARYGTHTRFGSIRSYEATKVLLRALEHAPTPTRAGVLTALHNLGEFSGTLGTWRFDANGDPSARDIDCLRLEDGSWVWVRTVHP